jgi:DNA-directed RNA polymerase subunit RPC12/RpoP
MDSSLVGLLFTVIIAVVTIGGSLLAVVVSLAIPAAILWYVYKQVSSGKATLVVSGPLVDLAAASRIQAGPPAPVGPTMVKRTRCPACGAPKVQRSLSAYVYCDFCGHLVDWDFQACLADKRSRLPGPTYEALLRSLGPKLASAKASGDRAAYRAAQVEIWQAYATVCPAALPPRIGDPVFREAWVQWSADSQTEQDLDPSTTATLERQNATVQALQWDRSDPFRPRIQPGSFDTLLDAVLAHQRAATELLERRGLLARHPDHPTAELYQHIGVSALVQGWIPFFRAGETERILEKTGLKDHYDEVAPPTLRDGPCPSCGAPLQVVEGARRVLCHGCGHLAGVGTGTLPCHGCGAPVTLPESGSLLACPNCSAELRLMRHG